MILSVKAKYISLCRGEKDLEESSRGSGHRGIYHNRLALTLHLKLEHTHDQLLESVWALISACRDA